MNAAVLVMGCGQVGAFASTALKQQGETIYVADKEPVSGYFLRYGGSERDRILQLDVADQQEVRRTLSKYSIRSVVLTFGDNGSGFADQSEELRRDNLQMLVDFVDTCCNSGVDEIVYVSSFAVYGRQATDLLSERAIPTPDTEYGRAKLFAENRLLETVANRASLIILRPSGLFGPIRFNKGSHSARLIDTVLFAAANNKAITLQWADGDADEYLYVKDLAGAITSVLSGKVNRKSGIYNVGSAEKVTGEKIRDSVMRIFPDAILNLEKISSDKAEMPMLDCSRIRRDFGHVTKFSFEEAIFDQAMITGLIEKQAVVA